MFIKRDQSTVDVLVGVCVCGGGVGVGGKASFQNLRF